MAKKRVERPVVIIASPEPQTNPIPLELPCPVLGTTTLANTQTITGMQRHVDDGPLINIPPPAFGVPNPYATWSFVLREEDLPNGPGPDGFYELFVRATVATFDPSKTPPYVISDDFDRLKFTVVVRASAAGKPPKNFRKDDAQPDRAGRGRPATTPAPAAVPPPR